MLVIDEYLAVDVLRGNGPGGLPDDDQLGLLATHHIGSCNGFTSPPPAGSAASWPA